jgi:hypothetical protein
MSMFSMPASSSTLRPAGGLRVKAVEPSTPDSSPEKATIQTSRRSRPRSAASWRATSRSAAVPEALSSAPLCGSLASGSSEPWPPSPRWS